MTTWFMVIRINRHLLYTQRIRPQFILIGLGNPGSQYEQTRHNVGFLAVDQLGAIFGTGEWQDKQKFLSLTQEATINERNCLLVKPVTFMNRSGEAIRKLVDFYKLDPATQIIVFCDDIDIELGTYRLRMNGGPGTHNGLKSIVDSFGEGFPRLRIGIGRQPEGMDLAAWVLSKISEEDNQKLEPVLQQLPAIIQTAVKEMETAMLQSKFKKRDT